MSTLWPESQKIISESLADLENDIKANEPPPEPGNEKNMFHFSVPDKTHWLADLH